MWFFFFVLCSERECNHTPKCLKKNQTKIPQCSENICKVRIVHPVFSRLLCFSAFIFEGVGFFFLPPLLWYCGYFLLACNDC